MAKAVATLLVLLSCLWPTVQDDIYIFSCNFTLKTGSKPRESIPQCSVSGVPLHSDDKDNTRKVGNAPKECADLFPKLKDIEEELWKQLHTMEEEGVLTTGNHSLPVTMKSQYKEGQIIDAYCNFTLDEQYSFIFYLKNRKWTVIQNNIPGIDKWKKNTELVKHLETFLIGDCGLCLTKLLLHWEKMTRSTSRTPDIGIVTSPSQLPSTTNTTQLPSAKQSPSKEGSSITEVIIPIVIFIVSFSVLSVFICICIYKCVKKKSHPQGGEMYCKLCFLNSCIFGNRRGQHTPSAVGEPCPEETICMTVMSPLEGDSPHCSSASST